MKKKSQHNMVCVNYFTLQNPFLILMFTFLIGFLVYLFVYKTNSFIFSANSQLLHAQTPPINVPIGTVAYIATSAIPSGWLECNGQSTSGYTELATIVGANVPDLRGQFIRGWDNEKGTDPGRTLGSYQADDLKSHTHGYLHAEIGGHDGNNGLVVRRFSEENYTTAATGGTETRPKNIALMAIIKY